MLPDLSLNDETLFSYRIGFNVPFVAIPFKRRAVRNGFMFHERETP